MYSMALCSLVIGVTVVASKPLAIRTVAPYKSCLVIFPAHDIIVDNATYEPNRTFAVSDASNDPDRPIRGALTSDRVRMAPSLNDVPRGQRRTRNCDVVRFRHKIGHETDFVTYLLDDGWRLPEVFYPVGDVETSSQMATIIPYRTASNPVANFLFYVTVIHQDEQLRSLSSNEGIGRLFRNGDLLFARFPEAMGGPPQGEGREKKEKRKNHEKRIRDFQSVPDYHPELGSLISTIVSILFAYLIFGLGLHAFDRQRTYVFAACVGASCLLAFQGTIGFVLGWDFWSLYHGACARAASPSGS